MMAARMWRPGMFSLIYLFHAEGPVFPAHKPEDGKDYMEVGVGKQGEQQG